MRLARSYPLARRKTTTRSRRDRRGEMRRRRPSALPPVYSDMASPTQRIDGAGYYHIASRLISTTRGVQRSGDREVAEPTTSRRRADTEVYPYGIRRRLFGNRTQWAVVSDVGANLRVCPPFEAASGRVLLNALRVAAPSPASQHDTRARSGDVPNGGICGHASVAGKMTILELSGSKSLACHFASSGTQGKRSSIPRKHDVSFDEASTVFRDPLASVFDYRTNHQPAAYHRARRATSSARNTKSDYR